MPMKEGPVRPLLKVIALSVLASRGYAAGPQDVILKRNLFAPLVRPAAEDTQKPIVPVVKPPLLDEVVALRGTVFLENSPSRSVALLEDLKSRQVDTFRVGDVIQNAKVVSIGQDRVCLEYAGEEFFLTERGAERERFGRDVPAFRMDLGDMFGSFEKDPECLLSLKAQPEMSNGVVVGYRVEGIRPSGPLGNLGIADGDVVTRINATFLRSPADALTAYENILRFGLRRVVVRLVRNGIPTAVVYELR